MEVSVGMCTYNGLPYLTDQLDSILEQSRTPDQIVICDDRSTDGTLEVLEEYRREFPDRIEVHVNDRNRGINGNFEHCLSKCEGDMILLSDQDDIWDADKISIQLNTLLERDADLAFHNIAFIDNSNEELREGWDTSPSLPGVTEEPLTAFQVLLTGNYMSGHTMMFRSSLKQHLLPFPSERYYDHFISLITTLVSEVVAIDSKLGYHRIHEDNASHPKTGGRQALRETVSALGTGIRGPSDRFSVPFWESVLDRVTDIDEEELKVSKQRAVSLLSERVAYERHRERIYESEVGFFESCRSTLTNSYRGYYSQFGNSHPALFTIKDLAAGIVSSSSSS